MDGRTVRSARAFENLKRICEEHLGSHYKIRVFDLAKNPHLAAVEQIVALPTVVARVRGQPVVKMMIGDLSDAEKVMAGLELRTKAG